MERSDERNAIMDCSRVLEKEELYRKKWSKENEIGIKEVKGAVVHLDHTIQSIRRSHVRITTHSIHSYVFKSA